MNYVACSTQNNQRPIKSVYVTPFKLHVNTFGLGCGLYFSETYAGQIICCCFYFSMHIAYELILHNSKPICFKSMGNPRNRSLKMPIGNLIGTGIGK